MQLDSSCYRPSDLTVNGVCYSAPKTWEHNVSCLSMCNVSGRTRRVHGTDREDSTLDASRDTLSMKRDISYCRPLADLTVKGVCYSVTETCEYNVAFCWLLEERYSILILLSCDRIPNEQSGEKQC